MTDTQRIYCTRCGQSIYNCTVDTLDDGTARRIPIVHRIVSGQPADTGPKVELDAPGVRVTSFTRETMLMPVSRIALGERCFAELFGLPRLEATQDPMYDTNNNKIPDQLELGSEDLSTAERFERMHRRTLHAILVARGVALPSDLPPEYLPPATQKSLDSISDEELARLGLQRIPATSESQ